MDLSSYNQSLVNISWSQWVTQGGGSSNQTEVPTGDGDTSGTWTVAPLYSKVAKTTANDFSYMTGTALGGSLSQTLYPTGDVSTYNGTWVVYPATPTTRYDKVNQPTQDGDTTYIKVGSTSGTQTGYMLFTSSNFSVPVGATITNLTIGYVARDDTSGTNSLNAAIRVNNTNYLTTDHGADPGLATLHGLMLLQQIQRQDQPGQWQI